MLTKVNVSDTEDDDDDAIMLQHIYWQHLRYFSRTHKYILKCCLLLLFIIFFIEANKCDVRKRWLLYHIKIMY